MKIHIKPFVFIAQDIKDLFNGIFYLMNGDMKRNLKEKKKK